MRTPLTAIQGSSEIMTRYNLPDEKRHAVERDDQLGIEAAGAHDSDVSGCRAAGRRTDGVEARAVRHLRRRVVLYKRAVPLAERKKIDIVLDTSMDAALMGDRELMEYALYNLLTNAVKYSPAETEFRCSRKQRGGELRLAVRDQGIGMDAKELKNIFRSSIAPSARRLREKWERESGFPLSNRLSPITAGAWK